MQGFGFGFNIRILFLECTLQNVESHFHERPYFGRHKLLSWINQMQGSDSRMPGRKDANQFAAPDLITTNISGQ